MKKIDTYKIGVRRISLDNIGGGFDVSFYCSCGNKRTGTYLNRLDIPTNDTCPDCGNTHYLEGVENDKRSAEPFFKVISKTNRGFEIERTNLSMIFHSKEDFLDVIRPNLVRRLVFDYVDGYLKCYRNDILEYDSREDAFRLEKEPELAGQMKYSDVDLSRINNFFMRKLSVDSFINEIGTETSKYFYQYIDKKYANSGWGAKKDKKILFRLRRLLSFKSNSNWAQILTSAGFTKLSAYDNFSYYGDNNGDMYGSTPAEILAVPKFTIKYLLKIDKESGNRNPSSHSSIRRIFKKGEIENNKLSELLQIADENNMLREFIDNIDRLQALISAEGYNLKRLMEYCISELPMYQGITSVSEGTTLIRDYVRMSKEMGFEYDKYPKSLKKSHDIAMVNYRAFKNDLKEEDFFIATSAYKELEDLRNRSEYVILIPEKPEEIVEEGNTLHHCIASYLKRVQEGQTKILFMRKKESLESPLVSIEVKDGRVVQARGKSNRSVTTEEREYLNKWADKKGIAYA